jgi:hypothetical protein
LSEPSATDALRVAIRVAFAGDVVLDATAAPAADSWTTSAP